MNNIILSVITPHYNSSHVLIDNLCELDSYVPNWVEWIIVDDCSIKEEFEFLQEKISKLKMNIFLYKNGLNLGPGETRNKAIHVSKGRYITFCDADDKLKPEFFSKIKNYLISSNYDCVIFDAIYINKNFRISLKNNNLSTDRVDAKQAFVYCTGAPWGKVFKLDLIKENNVRFLKQKINEDMPFVKHAISCCKRIAYLKQNLYEYIQNEESVMHTYEGNDFLQICMNGFFYIDKNVDDSFYYEKEFIYMHEVVYPMLIYYLSSYSINETKMKIKKIIRIYPDGIYNSYLNNLSIHKKIIFFLFKYNLYISLKVISNIKRRRK